MELHTVFLPVVVFVLAVIKTTDAVSCYTCDHVSHPRDCDRIMKCQTGESCYAITKVQPDGTPYYKVGCMAQQNCPAANHMIGRRDMTICSLCCNTDFCNKELCDIPTHKVHGPRCLQCTSVEHPNHCGSVTECQAGQVCYTQEKYVFGERRYQLGCASGPGCFPTNKRLLQARAGGLCLKCCSDENCNGQQCLNTGAPVTQAPATIPTQIPHHSTGAQHHTTGAPHHTTVAHVSHTGCYYKGHVYHTGDHWDDGCEFTCTCVDGSSGRYKCHDKCPTYTHLPSNCKLVTPPGHCCAEPECTTNFTSSTLNNRCFYGGNTYSQGEKWRDGCKFDCQCVDAEQGQYRCTSLCYTWTLPSQCHMEPPAAGKCCQVPKCPAHFTISYPPGYVEN